MNVSARRKEILNILHEAKEPIAAKEFAARFGVSRQVISQDFAVIRASVPGIVSTYRGYILEKGQTNVCSREFKLCHTQEETEKELNIIVDYGGHVKNVSISHRVYGRVTAKMDIQSRQDVKEYVAALKSAKSTLLSSATSGYHYHLVEAASEERLDKIEEELLREGILAPLSPWEQQAQERKEGDYIEKSAR